MREKVTVKSERRDLTVPLTDAEVADVGVRIEELMGLIEEAEKQLAEERISVKEIITDYRTELAPLRESMRTRHAIRPVPCSVTRDWDAGKVITTRDDTGQQIGIRDMTEGERQMEME